MKKKNKKEDINKLQDNEEKVEMENYWDVFVRNYRNVPGFKSLVKLLIYLFLIFIFIIVASSGYHDEARSDKTSNKTSTTIPTKDVVSYQDMLESVLKNEKKIAIEVISGDNRYLIDADINEGIMLGYYTTRETTKKFSIEENKIYELNLDERLENSEFFNDINVNFINQHTLVNIIKNNIGTKELKDGEIIYNYAILDNNINYVLQSFIKDNALYKIEIKGDNISYNISYK